VTQGTPVPVTAGITTPNINFILEKGAAFSGGVPFGAFFTTQKFRIYDARGVELPNRTALSGSPTSGYLAVGLPTGTYFLKADRDTQGCIRRRFTRTFCAAVVPSRRARR
jgi:hypothetical protein